MAFEPIYEYIDALKKKYIDIEKKMSIHTEKEECRKLWAKQDTIFDCLVAYDQTVLRMPKFKSQRIYMKSVMILLRPAYAEGYYKLKPTKETNERRKNNSSIGS